MGDTQGQGAELSQQAAPTVLWTERFRCQPHGHKPGSACTSVEHKRRLAGLPHPHNTPAGLLESARMDRGSVCLLRLPATEETCVQYTDFFSSFPFFFITKFIDTI